MQLRQQFAGAAAGRKGDLGERTAGISSGGDELGGGSVLRRAGFMRQSLCRVH